MKKITFILYLITVSFANVLFGQANTNLSNLNAPAINRNLVPGSVYSTLDLGNSSDAWRSIYVGTNDDDSISSYIMYYTGNIFLHNSGGAMTGGNPEGLFLGEFAGEAAGANNNGNLGVGYSALKAMTNANSGDHNTAIGWRALINMDDADKNTMVGSKAGTFITSGSMNTGVGWNVFTESSGTPNMSGIGNIAIGAANEDGDGVLGNLSDGDYNVVVGTESGLGIIDGSNNIIVGALSGNAITSGHDNIFIGESTGNIFNTGNNNIIVGSGADFTSNTSDLLNIGNTVYGNIGSTKKIGIGSSALPSTFNVGSNDQFQVNSSGKFPKYGNTTPTNGMLLIGSTSGAVFETGTIIGGSGILTTNGSGSITLDLDINELTNESNIDVDDDDIPFYDASATANKKLTPEALLAQYVTSYRKNRFDYYNEFINGISTGTGGNDIIANNNGSGAGSASTSGTSGTNIVGLVRSQTGTDADGRTSCATYNSAVAIGGGEWSYELRINGIAALSDASGGAEIYQLLIGFYDVNTTQNQSDGIYFLYDRAGVSTSSTASANWQLVTSSNATRTFTTTTTAVATSATTLKIVVNASGTSVEFFVNGSSVGTHTTNIPTGTSRAVGFGWMLMKSTGTTNRALEIDYLSVQCDYTTSK